MLSTFDDILVSLGRGKFQYLIFFACSSWGIFGSMHLMMSAFIAPQAAGFECEVQELLLANWTLSEKRSFSLPWTEEEGHSKCFQYQRNYSQFISMTYNESVTLTSADDFVQTKCKKWTYDTEISNSTLVSEFELVCDRHYLRSLVQSVFMAGVLLAALLGGYLADKLGRVRLISGGFVLYVLSGLASGFAPSFHLFLVSRFVVAFSGNFVYLTSYVLLLEWCQPRERSILGLAFSIPFAVGYMALPLVAFYVREWRMLIKVISTAAIALLFNLLIMLESPRWLIQNGKIDQAIKTVNYARKINGKPLLEPQYLSEAFTQIRKMPNKTKENLLLKNSNNQNHSSLSDKTEMSLPASRNKSHSSFVTSKLFKYSSILTINWFVCNLVYYGLSLNAGNLGVDLFLYMFLGGLMEIPCYTIIVPFVVKYGRRLPLISFFVVCGISVLSSLALSADQSRWGFVFVSMIGKLNITSAFQLLYLYTSEIFPTNFRTLGVGITSTIGRLGSILSPIIIDFVGSLNWRLPIWIFGCSTSLAGFVTFFLPETNEKALPDTAEDVEGWIHYDTESNPIEALIKDETDGKDEKERVKGSKEILNMIDAT